MNDSLDEGSDTCNDDENNPSYKRETEEERERDQPESEECCISSTLPFNDRGSRTTLNWYYSELSF